MELEDMKTAWKELDGRLGKQEMFRENFIRDSIADRSQRSVNKLLRAEIGGAVVCLLLMLLMIWFYCWPAISNVPIIKLFCLQIIVILSLTFVWELVKAIPLFKIDISDNVSDNIRLIRRFELYMQYEIRSLWILIPFLYILCIVVYASLNASLWLWTFMIGVNICALLIVIYSYKKVIKKNIGLIRKSLDELRDLDDDRE